ncbi:phenylalanine--tRNA ligase subunit beta [Blattabacterium cuenoti]|uniref:phenylalanine--tRNA ligase subunit beta n=1 Tax=Blattabacterium cuenoti TaxID=1653831 RepID=UPI00163C7301|nr:phenylalanine--tRNA ligase subunit beta [Blattabacterium cuenoti]
MKISYHWLQKYIPLNININKISYLLNDIGFYVKKIKKVIINNNIKDFILDIEITQNRSDAMSHYGIARELYIILKFRNYKNIISLNKPTINYLQKDIDKYFLKIFIEEKNQSIRYSGVVISEIKIKSSPDWLNFKLKSIGIKPINNIIDIINFVTYELGQPIHVFDMDKIQGRKIFIKKINKKIIFQSEDNIKRELNEKDLIISDDQKPLSIAGIINSNISNIHHIKTKNIFLGSIYLNPKIIRSIGLKHFINTDARFRLEKGVDPNQTFYALQRTANLIKKIINGKISSDFMDIYQNPIIPLKIVLRYQKINDILGKKISKKKIKKILLLLKIIIISENEKSLLVSIPSYRKDVRREIDLIEEILRIYGIHKIKVSNNIKISPLPKFYPKENIQNIILNQLINYGFQEIINLPMINKNEKNLSHKKYIKIINPINKNYHYLRTSLLFGIINSIKYNFHRGNYNLKFFEIGKIYFKKNNQFLEKTHLSIAISQIEYKKKNTTNFFYLKGIIEQIFQKIGIVNYTQNISYHTFLKNNLSIKYKNKNIVDIGKIKMNCLKNKEIFYAEIDWEYLISINKEKKIIFIPYSKYPIAKRDLSVLVDKKISFEKIHQLLKKKEKNFIKKIKIYDLYEGKNLPKFKKSYTISFVFENIDGTLTDIIIQNIMNKIEIFLIKKLQAQIRGIESKN